MFVVGNAQSLEDEGMEGLLKEGMAVPREGRERAGEQRALHAESLA